MDTIPMRWLDSLTRTSTIESVRQVGRVFERLPFDFELHPRVEKIIADRLRMNPRVKRPRYVPIG